MKNKLLYGFVLMICHFEFSCTRAQSVAINHDRPAIESKQGWEDKNVLVVYLTRTKNTKVLAELIHVQVGGDLIALELETPYPDHYQTTVDQVAQENSAGYLPPLKTKIDNMERYDAVFIGFPTWGMQLPPPIKSFLKDNELGGKTVIPFNTNAGYGIGSSFKEVAQACSGCKMLEGYSTQGGKEREDILLVMEGQKKQQVEKEVQDWLLKINSVK
ncbi:flavodoxin family protein [Sphingobacterium chungjuense]|uniref:flavodoxin family protein n=1 Tax=Sphingobacterium chungjuense TaxID=2675553 RepID=UPI00140B3A5C|nr:flavodoxin [Sphingobacterium chungjuense]